MAILSTASSEEPIYIGCPKDEYALLEHGKKPRRRTDASSASIIESLSSETSSFSKLTTSQDATYDKAVHNGEEYRMLLDFVRRLWEMEAYIFWMAYAQKQVQVWRFPRIGLGTRIARRVFGKILEATGCDFRYPIQGDPAAKMKNGVSIRAFERLYAERERAVSLKRKIDAYFRPRLNLAGRKTTRDNFPIDFEELLFHWDPWYPSQPAPYSRVDNGFDANGVREQFTDYYTSEGYWVFGMTEARGRPYMTFDRSWQGIELLRSETSGFDLFEPLTKIGAEKHIFDD
ncbi:hypothetical protein DL766_009687 [Monosporascus sp. MC13-8B]|uniref:Uncharacterized protein n=1 Tax=Monosporascus cannonballus TaxID=155416 RepID=A0ABY0H8N2_9PEZI|nr:hypothetical protein DL762_004093 [Monosporascus cannonballus]RYO94385.1 hypothetical protein DL763_004101 [Monosporascus cannonballus]RYP14416.1 hypothetical protein DL766_009687 [Monosporascus sp. MC13-8B]